jgi:hypothetical protein
MNTIAMIPLCFMAWMVPRDAIGAAVDAFPDALDELAAQFFARFRPVAEA